jgi:hypothetical protein
MSDTEGLRDERGRFIPGHAPLLGAGRPLGSTGLGKIRPLFDMMKQAAESEMLVAAAEAKPSVAALLRRRRSTAERVRRHRERQRNGMRIARVHFAAGDIAALVEGGFLPEGRCTADDFERAVYAMIDVIQDAKSTGRLRGPAAV